MSSQGSPQNQTIYNQAYYQRRKTLDPGWRQRRTEQTREYLRKKRIEQQGRPGKRGKPPTPESIERLNRKSQYPSLYLKQEGKCRICEREPGSRKLSIDHSHSTGQVRGLLCTNCNLALGNLKDSPLLAVRAAQYLMGQLGS